MAFSDLLPTCRTHVSQALTLPPQQLEVYRERQLLKSVSLAWRAGATDLMLTLSEIVPIFTGHGYAPHFPWWPRGMPSSLPFPW